MLLKINKNLNNDCIKKIWMKIYVVKISIYNLSTKFKAICKFIIFMNFLHFLNNKNILIKNMKTPLTYVKRKYSSFVRGF
jgi:hypothetical protein